MANQNQGPGRSGKQGRNDGPVLPEGEKIGEWSEDEEGGKRAEDPAEAGGGGFNAPSRSNQESEKPGPGSDRRWGQ
jgi:hypothetical protein